MSRRLAPVPDAPAVVARDLDVVISGAQLLRQVSLEVPVGEHVAVLGPNGAGKTTLLQLLATYRFPTRGSLELFGHRLGRVDVRALRPSIGLVSVVLDPLVDDIEVRRLVAGSRIGATLPPPGILEDAATVAAADAALERVGAGHLAARRVHRLSQGERQRVRIARALASDPELLLLDEPFAGLDVGGRERLLDDLDRLLSEPGGPTVVVVTHHLEELPTQLVRAVLLADGATAAAGPIDQVLTSAQVSAVFGVDLRVERAAGGRWRAVGARAGSTRR